MRCSIYRFGYEAPSEQTPSTTGRRRRGRGEVRNLDQYSTDDEFVADSNDGRTTSRRRKNVCILLFTAFVLDFHLSRGKSLLESWVTTFLPERQSVTLNLCLIDLKLLVHVL